MRRILMHVSVKGPDTLAQPIKPRIPVTASAAPKMGLSGKEQEIEDAAAKSAPESGKPVSSGGRGASAEAKNARKAAGWRSLLAPLFFGGAAAALICGSALYLAQENGWIPPRAAVDELAGRLDAQEREIMALRITIGEASSEIQSLQADMAEMAELPQAVSDLSSSAEVAHLDIESLSEAVTDLEGSVHGTNFLLSQAESQPVSEPSLPREIAESYDARLAEILDNVDARLDRMRAALDASVDAKLAEINAEQESAVKLAEGIARQTALAQIAAALDNGSEFTKAFAFMRETAVTGAEVPQVLADAAGTGVATLAQLQQDFPDAAREALAEAMPDAAADGSVSPLAAFFRTQLGARSLAPRAGQDPDAVLSRAEAALGAGDLDAALAEVEALPQAGQDAMEAWVAKAETRRAALAALAVISLPDGTN